MQPASRFDVGEGLSIVMTRPARANAVQQQYGMLIVVETMEGGIIKAVRPNLSMSGVIRCC
jgi:hypothetical protein